MFGNGNVLKNTSVIPENCQRLNAMEQSNPICLETENAVGVVDEA